MLHLKTTVNRRPISLEIEPRAILLDVLRDDLGLTGAKRSCDTQVCGACTVLLDGRSVKSCTVLAVQADSREVTTIEGLAKDGEYHPLQRAFHEQHALQCGYCTPGMIMAALSLIEENGELSEADIRVGLEGNLCRCTGYHNIVKAIQAAAQEMRSPAPV